MKLNSSIEITMVSVLLLVAIVMILLTSVC